MWFGVWKNDMILLIMKDVFVCKSRVFELLAMETRGESSTKARSRRCMQLFVLEWA